jgi:4-amino-4-deoxy-L-arabinose transferase-like glycosyltransferase
VRRRPWLAALALIAGAAFLATRLALVWRMPPFWDEAYYATWALDVFHHPRHPLRSLDFGKEPLLTWLGLVPLTAGAGPLTALREVSVFAGLVSMVAVGLLARELAGAWAGIAASLVYASLPFFVVHESLGLMEPLLVATLMVAVLLQVRMARDPRPLLGAGVGLATGAALLTKGTGLMAVAALPASLLCFDWQAPLRGLRLRRWAASAGLAVAIAGAAYLILLTAPAYHRLAEERPESLRTAHDAFAHPGQWWNAGWPNTWHALEAYFTKPLLVLAAVGLVLALIARRARLSALVCGWIGASVVLTVLLAKTPYPRYLAVGVGFLAVLTGCGLAGTVSLVRAFAGGRRWAGTAAAVALAAAWVPAIRFDARVIDHPATYHYPALDYEQYVTGGYAGTGWNEVADEITRRTAGRPTKIVWAGLFSWALPLRLDGRDSVTVADFGRPPARRHSGFVGLDAEKPETSLAGASFLVLSNVPAPPAVADRLEPLVTYRRPENGAAPATVLRLYRVLPEG